MTLPEELKARGLVEHTSAEVEKIFAERRTVYIGTDPTGDSLHVGHLAWVLLMQRLANAGHSLVILVGGATGMIGDPKEKGERPLLDEATVKANARALDRQLRGILKRTPFKMVNNADWLKKVDLISFLRDIGKHFTVNDLAKREVIARRLANPDDSISYTEFTYPLLQGYDYLHLNKKLDCDVQIGASDQWTNILSGVDLVRRKEGKEVFAFTIPLVTDATGKKFGKSEGNAVWLDGNKTSPYAFYQFWMNLPDEKVEQYYKIYTFLPLEEIAAIMARHQEAPQEREAQEELARIMTEIVHGPAAAAQAAAATDALFGGRPFAELIAPEREAAAACAPSVRLSKRELVEGASLVDALVVGGIANSKSDARRLIEGKSVTLNDIVITAPDHKIYAGDLIGGYGLVRKGKREVLVLVLK